MWTRLARRGLQRLLLLLVSVLSFSAGQTLGAVGTVAVVACIAWIAFSFAVRADVACGTSLAKFD